MAVVGLGIVCLGILAKGYANVIIAVGTVIFLASLAIYKATMNKKTVKG